MGGRIEGRLLTSFLIVNITSRSYGDEEKLQRADRDRCQIVIEDNGIGFDDDRKAALFLPFQRLGDRRDVNGPGIGLTTVKKIVDRLGGSVEGHNKEGEGAAFVITLPLTAAEAVVPEAVSSPRSRTD